MRKKIFLVLLLITTISVSAAFSDDSEPDFAKMMESLDMRSNFEGTDFSSKLTIITEDPEEGVTKEVTNQFRNDENDQLTEGTPYV